MTISYNWLTEYLPAGQAGLPEKIEPEKLSKILTSIGLEVESLEKYEAIKGNLLMKELLIKSDICYILLIFCLGI